MSIKFNLDSVPDITPWFDNESDLYETINLTFLGDRIISLRMIEEINLWSPCDWKIYSWSLAASDRNNLGKKLKIGIKVRREKKHLMLLDALIKDIENYIGFKIIENSIIEFGPAPKIKKVYPLMLVE